MRKTESSLKCRSREGYSKRSLSHSSPPSVSAHPSPSHRLITPSFSVRYAFQDDENCYFVLDLMPWGDLRRESTRRENDCPNLRHFRLFLSRSIFSPLGTTRSSLSRGSPALHPRVILRPLVSSRQTHYSLVRQFRLPRSDTI